MSVTDTIQAYCVKCRKKQTMAQPQAVTTKTGRNATRGACPVCGTALFSFQPLGTPTGELL